MQRILDVIISLLAMLFLSPLLIPLMIILRFTGEGEVFFSQLRVGKGQRSFRLYKFATMLKDSPNLGTGTLTIHNDPRVLPLGKFLRKSKINELPQIFNLFKGDISLIGPRPQSPRNFDAFSKESKLILSRLSPGLTGIGSLVFSDEEALLTSALDPDDFYDSEIMPYKADLEIWYERQAKASINFKIVGLTVAKIFFPWIKIDLWQAFDDLPLPPLALKSLREE